MGTHTTNQTKVRPLRVVRHDARKEEGLDDGDVQLTLLPQSSVRCIRLRWALGLSPLPLLGWEFKIAAGPPGLQNRIESN